ncbi:putative ribonuclease H-like domain-containing protein [Tanacetum coccineum]|uniref:Ribonuclease H-like domain-containing protein n=1 Tax=Tanacetum coccineum TaxID=301880 RepID=A0ABQ5HV70_9ASTR
MAFVSSPSSTYEVNTDYGVSTNNTQVSPASTQFSTTSIQVSIANLSDATIYAFLANKPNESQLVHEDLEQIHEDDLEEIDLKWQLALLSMRTRRGPKNQDSRNRNHDNSKRTINVEETSSKAMVAIDGAGFDRSYMADDEVPTSMFLMAFLDSKPEFKGYGPKTSKSVSEDIYNEVREFPNAPLVEELVLDNKLEKKIIFPTVAKIEFVRPKQQEKPVRKLVKYAEMYMLQSPRGNQRNWNNQKSQQLGSDFGHPQKEYQGYVDSGCSRHMTGDMSYLSDFKEFDGGYVTFGGGAKGGKITGKGTLKTGKLDFKDVYFSKELQFNLFNVSKMCDKKNSVLLKVPRKNNMYSVDMKNIVPKEYLTCLVAKATLDDSMLWASIGGLEFQKNRVMSEFCEEKGIKKEFNAARTPQQNSVAERRNRTLIEAVKTMLVDSKLPTTSWAEAVNTVASKFDGKSDKGFFVGYLMNSKVFRVYNIRTRKVEENLYIRFLEDKPIIAGTNSIDLVGTGRSIGAGHSSRETGSSQDYILMPLPSINTEPYMFSLGDNATLDATHADFFGDETEVDMSNITTTYLVPSTPNIRIHKDHSFDYVIGDVQSGVQTRRMIKTTNEQGFISAIYERKTHEDLHTYLFACFLSQKGPKRISKALSDLAWVEVMQEELLQFMLQKVWVLVDLPKGKRAIGTKWVFRNKKNERGIVIQNKARLEVYVCQPLGFEDPEYPDKVYKVVKALYGLHQAPRVWSMLMILSLALQRRRLQVKQKDDGIFISQDKYVADILRKFSFIDVRTASTPMDIEKPLLNDSNGDDVDVHLYRSMIGSLMYLTSSRPNIMFAVYVCARFQVTLKVSHLHVVKRIFRYLKGQPKLGLWFPRDSSFDLVAYSDSDYAGASLDRKSTTRGCQFLGYRLISWQCKKQTVVATSSTKAEYVAAASYCGQVLWIHNQMLDYGISKAVWLDLVIPIVEFVRGKSAD